MINRLQAVHVYKQNTDHRTGDHICDQHFHTIVYDFIVADEHADDRLSACKIQECSSNSCCKTAYFGEALHFPETADISCSVTIPQKRLHSICQSHLQKSNEHICFKNNTNGCYWCISIFYQYLINDNGGYTHKSRKNSGWQTDIADFQRNLFP